MPEPEVPKFDIYTKEKITRAEETERLNAAVKGCDAPTWQQSQFARSPRHRKQEPKKEPETPEEWKGYVYVGRTTLTCGNPCCHEEKQHVAEFENGKKVCSHCSWDQDLEEVDFTHMEMIANQ